MGFDACCVDGTLTCFKLPVCSLVTFYLFLMDSLTLVGVR